MAILPATPSLSGWHDTLRRRLRLLLMANMRPLDGVLSGFRLAGPQLRQSSVPMISEMHQRKNGMMKIDRQMHWHVHCSALLNFAEG